MDCSLDREIWANVMNAVKRAAKAVGRVGRRCVYADRLIAAMYLWCVWHDRPLSWACDRVHYNTLFRPRRLPSVSQFTRRVKTDALRRILQRVHDELAAVSLATPLSYLDGKPLVVGGASKDRDARRGRAVGGFGKGYKLHALVSEDGRIPTWSVTPLNAAEHVVAQALCLRLPPSRPAAAAAAMPWVDAMVLGDSGYDSAPLHKVIQAASNACLLTPLRGQQRVKDGVHHPVTLRQMGGARREAVVVWRDHPRLARFVLKRRIGVENTFSALTCAGGGLGPLPAWTRTLGRVTRWVGGKIILYHARLRVKNRAAA
jgi:hypothetical protein